MRRLITATLVLFMASLGIAPAAEPAGTTEQAISPVPKPEPQADAQQRAEARRREAEQHAWDAIKDSQSQIALQDFINRYPTSSFAVIAAKRLKALDLRNGVDSVAKEGLRF